jgi:hypothetical protein
MAFDGEGRVILHRDDLKSGICFYQVVQKNKIFATGKLVVE